MSLPELGAGDVEIQLNGVTKTLRCSYGAAVTLSRYAGGLSALQQQIMGQNIEAIGVTIAAGLGVEFTSEFAEQVYQNGLWDVFVPCGTYVGNLSNGGRPLTMEDMAGAKGKKKAQANR